MVHWYSVSKDQIVETLAEVVPGGERGVSDLLGTLESIPFTWDGFHPGIVLDAVVARLRLASLLEGPGIEEGHTSTPMGIAEPSEGIDQLSLAGGLAVLGPQVAIGPSWGAKERHGGGGHGAPPTGLDDQDANDGRWEREQLDWEQGQQEHSLQVYLLTTCFETLGKDDYLHTHQAREPEGSSPPQVVREREGIPADLARKYQVTRLVYGRGGVGEGTEEGFHRFFDDLLGEDSRRRLGQEWILEGDRLEAILDAQDILPRMLSFLYGLRAFSSHPALPLSGPLLQPSDLHTAAGGEPYVVEERRIIHPAGGVWLRWRGSFQVGDHPATVVDALRQLVLEGMAHYLLLRVRTAGDAPRLLQPRL